MGKRKDRKDFNVKKYSWVELGGNYYPSELQSAFLDIQIQYLNKVIAKRKIVFKEYYNFFSQRKFNKLFYTISDQKISNYHMFYLVFYSKKLKDAFLKFMNKYKISCQTHYEPLHSSKMGRKK